jgi:D-glycero-alpha-D-manno-heptose 1-phosphate guanylyltransferase
MEAIILSGGFGTRLREVVPDLPKPMASVAGRPFLEILLLSLASKGFKRIILSVGFMANKISDHFGHRFAGMELLYAVENSPLGTGGAVRLALSKCLQDHVFVFNGDTYLDLEVDAVESLWLKLRHPIIVGRELAATERYGRLLTSENRVTGFSEKGLKGHGLINAGCYVLNRDQLDHFALNQAFSIETDFLTSAVKSIPVEVFVTTGLFIDIGIPQDYALAQALLADAAQLP